MTTEEKLDAMFKDELFRYAGDVAAGRDRWQVYSITDLKHKVLAMLRDERLAAKREERERLAAHATEVGPLYPDEILTLKDEE